MNSVFFFFFGKRQWYLKNENLGKQKIKKRD